MNNYLKSEGFRKGLKVTCFIDGKYINDACLSQEEDEKGWFICTNRKICGLLEIKDIKEIKYGYKYGYYFNEDYYNHSRSHVSRIISKSTVMFTKEKYLKSGMIVEFNNPTKNRFLLVNSCSGIIGINENDVYSSAIIDCLDNKTNLYSIVKVYFPKNKRELIPKNNFHLLEESSLIWKYEEKKQLTVAQIEEKLGYPVEVVRG